MDVSNKLTTNITNPLSAPLRTFEKCFSGEPRDFKPLLDQLIDLGSITLDMELGVVSQIFGDQYFVLSCSPDSPLGIKTSQTYELKNTFSEWVCGHQKLLAIENIEAEAYFSNHGTQQLQNNGTKAQSYIGAPILVNERVVGTVSFASHKKRPKPFTLKEGDFITSMAEMIGRVIQQCKIEHSTHNIHIQETSMFNRFFANSLIGMAQVSLEGKWLNTNYALSNLLGYSQEELLKTDLQSITHPDDIDSDLELIQELFEKNTHSYQIKKRYYHRDGSIIWAHLTVTLIRDDKLKPRYFISTVQDITEAVNNEKDLQNNASILEAMNKKLSKQSIIDPLTQVYNRRHLLSKLSVEMKRSDRSMLPLSIIMLDIDHFNKFNDQHGQLDGDKALIATCEVLKSKCRASDTIARYDGEQFVILLPHTHLQDAKSVAEALRKKVRSIKNLPEKITISLGISYWNPKQRKNPNGEKLLQEADKALHQAKDKGRDRIIAAELERGVLI